MLLDWYERSMRVVTFNLLYYDGSSAVVLGCVACRVAVGCYGLRASVCQIYQKSAHHNVWRIGERYQRFFGEVRIQNLGFSQFNIAIFE